MGRESSNQRPALPHPRPLPFLVIDGRTLVCPSQRRPRESSGPTRPTRSRPCGSCWPGQVRCQRWSGVPCHKDLCLSGEINPTGSTDSGVRSSPVRLDRVTNCGNCGFCWGAGVKRVFRAGERCCSRSVAPRRYMRLSHDHDKQHCPLDLASAHAAWGNR